MNPKPSNFSFFNLRQLINILCRVNALPFTIIKVGFCKIRVITRVPFPAFVKQNALGGNTINTKYLILSQTA